MAASVDLSSANLRAVQETEGSILANLLRCRHFLEAEVLQLFIFRALVPCINKAFKKYLLK